jgi:hypothetical protein
MIRGYVEQPSPRPGETGILRVSCDAPRFRVELYRCGATLQAVGRSGWLPGHQAPDHRPYEDWGASPGGWAAYRFVIPAGCSSGVYVAMLVEEGGPEPDRSTPDARTGNALFTVRGDGTAPILYKLPLLTYHAYNVAGDWCLYNRPDGVPDGVSLHRPGGGTGAPPYDLHNPDPYDPTPRQTFVHWDARFVRWLEGAGYRVEYCTDADLHREGADLLAPYRLLVSVGHDEYWSDAMRDAVEGYQAGGGNAAFFTGNTCWWRVVFADDVTFARVGFWHATDRPENAMVGSSFRNGGERDRDDHPVPVGYTIQHADHWVFAGTGLADGDVIGLDEYLVGYECDGVDFDRDGGRPVRPSGLDGAPPDFCILGVGDTRTSGPWGFGNGAATMGVFHPGGIVFSAGTTDWARVLTGGTAPAVERITRNVLDRLSAS